MPLSRRKFIAQSAVAATGLSAGLNAFANPITKNLKNTALKISVFSKNLHWLNYKDMATAASAMGFDGVDLTVRPNGHVLPGRVEEDLPKAVNILRDKGLNVYMITTAIKSASDEHAETILKTAAKLGIGYYRLGWFVYDKNTSIIKNIDNFKKTFEGLATMNRQNNIHGDYQNHAGEGFGSTVIDLALALKDVDPEWLGCQYDIRHATVEGANSWPIGLSMINEHVKTINLKDFEWSKKQGRWEEENVPVGEGMVNFKKYFEILKSNNFNGPVCMHYEYALGGAENGDKKLTVPGEVVTQAMQRDLLKVKQWLAEAGLL